MFVVTGAAGFLGGHLVEALAARGGLVVGIDRRPGIPSAAAVRIVADLTDPFAPVDEPLRAADAVFHLAGCPGVRDARGDIEQRRRRDNVLAAERVLAAVPPSTPLVVTSSSSVYGGARGGRACREDDALRPVGGYAWSKVALEARCVRRLERGGLVAVARPFTVAGERQRLDMAIARWTAAAFAGDPLRIYGSSARTRDITDVRGVVEGLIRLAEREVAGAVNLGSGDAHRLDVIAAAVAEAVGVPLDLVVEPVGADEPPDTLADPTRARRLLDLDLTTDLRGLVARQVSASEPVPA
jgi:nucleoside-diphosphate-sugar epimerase